MIPFLTYFFSERDELNRIDKDMNKLKIDQLELDEDDERDNLIVKLQEVNEKLKFKLKDLEVIVEQTVKKAYTTGKEKDDGEDESIKEKDREIREYQAQIEGCKKTIKKLKNRLNALTNMEKMTQVSNELRDSQRKRKELEDEVKMLQRYQAKALKSKAQDTGFEDQMNRLSTELTR